MLRFARLAFCASVLAVPALFAQTPTAASAPKLDSYQRGRAHDMFRQTFLEVKKNYYDPTFHGVDLEQRFHEYDAKIDTAPTQGEAFRVIAAFLAGLQDSHLFFIPPPRPYRYDSGFRSEIVGDAEFVTEVKPGSGAVEQLQPGDRIVHLNGFNVNRRDQHDIQYYFNVLAPTVNFQLDVLSPGGEAKKALVKAHMTARPATVNLDSNDIWQLVRDEEADEKLDRSRLVEVNDVIVWKLPTFTVSTDVIDSAFKKISGHKALVLDLRGNGGGAIDTLRQVVGHLFNHDVKVFDEVSRKGTKEITAKSGGPHAFLGDLVVLIDEGSASCSELLPRIVQLEHRGFVVGDTSAGAVMESQVFSESIGGDVQVFYALSITHANALMSDGKSLEKTGVLPDVRVLPTPEDLHESRDPALSRAVKLAGGSLDPVAAGKLFPFEWPAN